jgi:hypothetical protein
MPQSRIFREPLFHFLLLAAALFAVNAWRNGQRAAQTAARIEVTAGTIKWLSEGYARQWHRAPDAEELRGLVTDHLREEVLYREALALGLDRDDTIVRRRMAQKMEFLTQDIAAAAPADEAALRKFFNENPDRYAPSARLSFRHVYFSRDRRGPRLEAEAREALAALGRGAGEETLGDPFMREQEFRDASADDITAALGPVFAEQVLKLPAGGWRGPIASSYGLHLVWVSGRATPPPVEFERVREAVARDLADEYRRAANRDFMERLQQRYQISVDEAALAAAAAPALKTARR